MAAALVSGDDVCARFLRAQKTNDRKAASGRSTALYNTVADSLAHERKIDVQAKRAIVEENRAGEIMLNKSRRLLANQEAQTADAKRKKAAEHVSADMERRVMNQQLAEEKNIRLGPKQFTRQNMQPE